MSESISEMLKPGKNAMPDPNFPHAPEDWTRAGAEELARGEGLALTEDHWSVIHDLQEYFTRHAEGERPNAREVHDALEEKYHANGGLRRLYELFPGGPVAQGCRLAGLNPPAGAVDKSFGSVQ
jgi:TusE/DsrC/DsvC family sulfur relay protein